MNAFGFYSYVVKRMAALPGKFSRWHCSSGEFAPEVARSVAADFSLEVPFGYVPGPFFLKQPLAVICHIYHADLTDEIVSYLNNIHVPVRVFISTDTVEKQAVIAKSFATWPSTKVEIRIAPNRGRDIAPKLITFADIYDNHEILLFLHSKKSPHLSDGARWRDYLMRTLLGSPATVFSVLDLFERFPSLGMIIPQHYEGVRKMVAWGSNYTLALALARKMSFTISQESPLDLPSGSMFWARSDALRPLLDIGFSSEDFPLEAGQIDGTIAHAIERLLLYVCEQAGYDWLKIADLQSSLERSTIVSVSATSELSTYYERYNYKLMNDAKISP